jgi:hypothetical protein
VTTYRYRKIWSKELINSNHFKKSSDHKNPSSMRFEQLSVKADKVELGAFTLNKSLINDIDRYEKIVLTDKDRESLSNAIKEEAKLHDGSYYFGATPNDLQIGDVKVSFKSVKPVVVSIIAKQLSSKTFEPYQTKAGNKLEFLALGSVSANEMFQAETSKNTMLTWILRFAGFLCMTIGLSLAFKPLTVIADVIPFLGDMLGLGLGFFSGVVAFALSFVTIALAWIAYRPIVGVPLLIGAASLIIGLKALGAKKKRIAAYSSV